MTEQDIWFNYQQAIAQADALDAIAGRLESTAANELNDSLETAAANWKGDNAKRYQGKCERLQARVYGTARTLHSAAEEIRAEARRVREIEMANLAIVLSQST